MLLSAIRSSTRTHTHPPNDPPSPTHATAIITHTDTSLHYINTPLKANRTFTHTKAFHNLSIKQTNKNKRTSRLGDLRLGDLRLRGIRLGDIRLRAIRLGVIRLRVIRLGAIRLGDIPLGLASRGQPAIQHKQIHLMITHRAALTND